MFKKELRVKSHTVVKKPERKSFFDSLSTAVPGLTVEALKTELFRDGEDIIASKAEYATDSTSQTGPKAAKESVPSFFNIYSDSSRQPLFFSFDVAEPSSTSRKFRTIFYPTLYAIWRIPSMISLSFGTFPEVISKLQNGADLMIAGARFSDSTLSYLNESTENEDPARVVVTDLSFGLPVAIGRLLMTKEELRARLERGEDSKGKLVEITHIIGDSLWNLGDKVIPTTEPAAADEDNNHAKGDSKLDTGLGLQSINSSEDKNESAEAHLKRIFLITLKSKFAEEKDPILASTLNAQMLAICRRATPDRPVEIKQTTYKKLGKFLEEMQVQSLINISEKNGVISIDRINWRHPEMEGIVALPEEPVVHETAIRIPVSQRQVYIINGRVAPILQSMDPAYVKGHEFRTTDEIKAALTKYIKDKNLASLSDPSVVMLDKALVDLVMNKSVKFEGEWPMKRAELFDKFLKEFSTSQEIVFSNGEFAEMKGKFTPIDVKIEKKAGNKLLTVIKNLEDLGMDPNGLAKELQKMVGAGVNVREEPNRTHSVTIQGDQSKLLDKYLIQTMGLPKKFITGLEKAGKK